MAPNIKLYTDRLYLRPFSADDIELHIAMMGEGAAIDFLTTNKKAQSYGEAWRACASFIGHWQIRGFGFFSVCLLYTSPSPRDLSTSRMPSSA